MEKLSIVTFSGLTKTKILNLKRVKLLDFKFNTTTTDKIFERSSSLHVKYRTMGKVHFFKEPFASIDKKFFWEEDSALGYNHEVLRLF